MKQARETLKEIPRELSKESKQKVEERLESLAKMYEAKRNQQTGDEAGSQNSEEEHPEA
jgi:hypothetical protein